MCFEVESGVTSPISRLTGIYLCGCSASRHTLQGQSGLQKEVGLIMDPKKKELASSGLKMRMRAWVYDRFDVKNLLKFFPTFFLIGMSVYVGYHMEAIYAKFQRNVKKGLYEREYQTQEMYEVGTMQEIMTRIEKFDGQSVPLPAEEEKDVTYKYERRSPRSDS